MNKIKNKAQGALEYLMIIGAAITISVIAVSLVISLSNKNREKAAEQTEQFETFIDNTIIPPMVLSVDCNKLSSSNNIKVIINPSPTRGVKEYCLYYNNSYVSCTTPIDNTLTFTHTILSLDRVKISISAQKGNAQSAPSSPALECYPHN